MLTLTIYISQYISTLRVIVIYLTVLSCEVITNFALGHHGTSATKINITEYMASACRYYNIIIKIKTISMNGKMYIVVQDELRKIFSGSHSYFQVTTARKFRFLVLKWSLEPE